MRLRRSVQVASDPEYVRRALRAPETFARCLPGAALEQADAGSAEGRLRVRIGGHQITYCGTATRAEGEALVWNGRAGQIRGDGEVSGSLRFTVEADPGGCTLSVDARLGGAGRIADFDRAERRTAGERLLQRLLQAVAHEVARAGARRSGPMTAGQEPMTSGQEPTLGEHEAAADRRDAAAGPGRDHPAGAPDSDRASTAHREHPRPGPAAAPEAPAQVDTPALPVAATAAPVDLRRQHAGVPLVAVLVAGIGMALLWMLRRISVRH